MPELERHHMLLPYQRGSQTRAQPKKQDATAAGVTSQRLHGGVIDDARRFAQRFREIKSDPSPAEMRRLLRDAAIAHDCRKTDGNAVEFPVARGFVKSRDKFPRSHGFAGI